MQTDAHFERGRTHAVCQDYALAGARHGGAWALVCDGCSSSPDTDTGARLLAHAAAAHLREGRLPGSLACLRVAAAAAARIGLDASCLDATIVAALALADRVVVLIRGDGFVAARRRDGTLHVASRRCRDECPDYPSVVGDPRRRARWLELDEPRAWIERCDRRDPVCPARGHAWVGTFDMRTYDRLIVATDGLATLRVADDPSPLDAAWVAARLLDVPSTTGCFVQRRLARLGRADGPFAGARPDDDIAVAALAWDDAA